MNYCHYDFEANLNKMVAEMIFKVVARQYEEIGDHASVSYTIGYYESYHQEYLDGPPIRDRSAYSMGRKDGDSDRCEN